MPRVGIFNARAKSTRSPRKIAYLGRKSERGKMGGQCLFFTTQFDRSKKFCQLVKVDLERLQRLRGLGRGLATEVALIG